MVWYSILPAEFITVESWAAQTFFLLGLLTIVPWAALVVFDILLFTCRMVAYEIPFVGGRARGRLRPPVFSLYERGTIAAAAIEALRSGSGGGGVGEESGRGDAGSNGGDNDDGGDLEYSDDILTERNPNSNWTNRGRSHGGGGGDDVGYGESTVRRRGSTAEG